MPNFKAHVLSGLFLFPVCFPVFYLLHRYLELCPADTRVIAFSFIFFTLGSDAPDLDHKNAYMHRIAKVIVWIGTTIYFYFFLEVKFQIWFPNVAVLRNEVVLFYICLFLGLICSQLFSKLMPRHRGPFHSVFAPFVFGIIVGTLFYVLEVGVLEPVLEIGDRVSLVPADTRVAIANAIYIGTSAFLGYTVHLILDYTQTYIKRRRGS